MDNTDIRRKYTWINPETNLEEEFEVLSIVVLKYKIKEEFKNKIIPYSMTLELIENKILQVKYRGFPENLPKDDNLREVALKAFYENPKNLADRIFKRCLLEKIGDFIPLWEQIEGKELGIYWINKKYLEVCQ